MDAVGITRRRLSRLASWLWKKSTDKFKIREVGENIYIEPLKDE